MAYWESELGWIYAAEETYPWVYRFDENGWLWFDRSSSDPRWFYNLKEAQWIEVDL